MKLLVTRRVRWIGLVLLGLGSLQCGSERESEAEAHCEALEREAVNAMANAALHAERSCALDSDCSMQDFSAHSLGGCGEPRAVASSAQSQLESEWSALEERYCAPPREPRCAARIASNIYPC